MAQPGLPGSQFPGEDAINRRIRELEQRIQQFSAANILATAGINAAAGGVLVNGFMQFRRTDETVGVQVDPETGTFTVFDDAGAAPVTRFGELLETAPGEYGVEVLVGSTWVRLGNQVTTWDAVSGKPATFPPSGHTHAGADITSAVANATNAVNATNAATATNATNATEATHAAQADGSQYGWTNNVAGGTFYALWVGNDGGYHFGRNVSSIKYKENVINADVDPLNVLQLRPVRYDRKATYRFPQDADGNRLIGPEQQFLGAKGEFGLIAEEVEEFLPEIVTRYDGQVDGVRYDLLGVALLPVVQEQQKQIDKLTAAVRALGGDI
ncbi:tail fiber domain-containing protein [Paenarthrobacter sp. TA1.8]|uniref:tail fiber domain-containing protein n=1 Tax=Paenarthrobacter sp. TA1.8 TaxID=3400219 RepID=UPI003B432FFC